MANRSGARKSTIVRLFMGMRLALARAVFAALERVAPAAAARWALRMWLTPPRARHHRDPLVPPGEWFTTPLAASPRWASRPRWGLRPGRSFAVAGRVVAETWGTGPVVYLLHGWGGARTQLGAFVAPLVTAGMQVVALDAPAHGESGPGRRRTTLPEMAAALSAVAAVTGPPHAVISHSAGSQATTLAVRDGLPADRLIFLAPMVSPEPYLDRFHHLLGHGPRTRARFRPLLERAAGCALAEFDLPAQAGAVDKPPPLLVIHDRDDRETPLAGGRALAEAWPDAELMTTTGLGHRRLLTAPEVVDAALTFIAGHDDRRAGT